MNKQYLNMVCNCKLVFFLVVVAIFSLLFVQFSLNGKVFFPIDDVYIYFMQAKNLHAGHFYTYSIGDQPVSSNTSLLYYFLSFLIWGLAGFISDINRLEVIVYISYLINSILLMIALITYRSILVMLYPDLKRVKILIFSAFSSPLVFFSFVNGLETGLTLTLLSLQLLLFLKGERIAFIILTILLSIHRPENIVVNVAYALIAIPFFSAFDAKKISLSFIVLLSVALTPLVNFIVTGDIRPASVARSHDAGFVDFLYVIWNNFFGILFIFPEWIPEYFEGVFKFVRYAFVIALIVFLSKRLFMNFNHIRRYLKDICLLRGVSNNNPQRGLAVIVVVTLSYVFLPLFFSASTGEWGRYFSPVIPFLQIFLVTIFNLFFLKILIVLNLILMPVYIVSYLNMTSNMYRLDKVGHFISKINSDKVVGLEVAGLMSHYAPGRVVDIYGLGTHRYMVSHGEYDKVYAELVKDNLDYIIVWESEEPRYYFDSSHAKDLYKNRLNKIMTLSIEPFMDFGHYPDISIYEIDK